MKVKLNIKHVRPSGLELVEKVVSILDKFSEFCFKKASIPETINNAKKEKIIKFKIKLKFPFLS